MNSINFIKNILSGSFDSAIRKLNPTPTEKRIDNLATRILGKFIPIGVQKNVSITERKNVGITERISHVFKSLFSSSHASKLHLENEKIHFSSIINNIRDTLKSNPQTNQQNLLTAFEENLRNKINPSLSPREKNNLVPFLVKEHEYLIDNIDKSNDDLFKEINSHIDAYIHSLKIPEKKLFDIFCEKIDLFRTPLDGKTNSLDQKLKELSANPFIYELDMSTKDADKTFQQSVDSKQLDLDSNRNTFTIGTETYAFNRDAQFLRHAIGEVLGDEKYQVIGDILNQGLFDTPSWKAFNALQTGPDFATLGKVEDTKTSYSLTQSKDGKEIFVTVKIEASFYPIKGEGVPDTKLGTFYQTSTLTLKKEDYDENLAREGKFPWKTSDIKNTQTVLFIPKEEKIALEKKVAFNESEKSELPQFPKPPTPFPLPEGRSTPTEER